MTDMFLDGWKALTTAKIPTFLKEKDGIQYGFELNGSVRRFFFVPKGELRREPISILPSWIQDEIIAKDKILGSVEVDSSTGKLGCMPEILTIQLLKKWQTISVEERLLMLQQTDMRYVEERKGRGGKIYPYVKGSYMIQCANMVFGFCWNTIVTEWKQTPTEVICIGYVQAQIGDTTVIKYSVGQQDIAYLKDSTTVICLGDNYKAAQMDMMKKALSYFGIAKDVYSGEIV